MTPPDRASLLRQGVCEGCGTETDQPVLPQGGGRTKRWCSERCRKRTLYGGTCEKCGATTNGYNGPGTASDECNACMGQRLHEERHWTRETIVTAIQRWASEHDGKPPTATDWNSALARLHARPARAFEFPPLSAVQREWGSWNAAIEAAGFVSLRKGHHGNRTGEEPAVRAQAVELYASGMSSRAVAARLGINPATVIVAARAAGVTVRSRGARRAA